MTEFEDWLDKMTPSQNDGKWRHVLTEQETKDFMKDAQRMNIDTSSKIWKSAIEDGKISRDEMRQMFIDTMKKLIYERKTGNDNQSSLNTENKNMIAANTILSKQEQIAAHAEKTISDFQSLISMLAGYLQNDRVGGVG
jgi:polyhydroxyalkanoate synthesis regulator phasin